MDEQPELISLADLIEQVKNDLLTNPATHPAFYIDGIEIAAQVVASRSKSEGGKAGVGLNLSVLGFKADAGINSQTALASEMTQTVTIKLSPLLSKEDYLAQLNDAGKDHIEQHAAKVAARGNRAASANPV